MQAAPPMLLGLSRPARSITTNCKAHVVLCAKGLEGWEGWVSFPSWQSSQDGVPDVFTLDSPVTTFSLKSRCIAGRPLSLGHEIERAS